MTMRSKKNRFIFLCAAVIIVALIFGCGRSVEKNASAKKTTDPGTLRSEVIRKISEKVIGGIPNSARLADIRRSGIIRVAYPAEQSPFQSLDPALKLPVGFNPALAAEIAQILEVKTNNTILSNPPDSKFPPQNWQSKYDLLFMPEEAHGCPAENSIRYFYSGTGKGWKTICAAGSGRELPDAVGEIMTYLNETGIFAQLYKTHVQP